MDGYQNLQIWHKARILVKVIYQTTATFPASEQFGLTNQIRRSAVSIPSNIAEGWSRNSTKDFINFLYIARGSLAELETQMTIGCDLGYITSQNWQNFQVQIAEVGKMLNGTITQLKQKSLDTKY